MTSQLPNGNSEEAAELMSFHKLLKFQSTANFHQEIMDLIYGTLRQHKEANRLMMAE